MKGASVFNYRLTQRLGGGGFGDVWEAEHTLTGKKFAVKVLHAATEPSVLAALKREALVLHRLSETWEAQRPREPAPFVHFVDVGEVEGRPAIVMELLVGHEVRAEMTGPWSVARTLDLATRALDALGFAHTQGVIHRDVKPENLFVVAGDEVKLLDFGIAKVQQTEGDKSSRVAGSLRYLAPERFDEVTTPACDVYAMGLVIWELLAGVPACASETITGALKFHTVAGVPDVRSVRPDVPPALADAVAKLCARDPQDRPPDGAAAAALLRAVAAPAATRWVHTPPVTPRPPDPPAPVAAPAPIEAPAPHGPPPTRAAVPRADWLRGLLLLGLALIGLSILLFGGVWLAFVAAFGAAIFRFDAPLLDAPLEASRFEADVDLPAVPVAEAWALSRFTAFENPELVAAAASDPAWCAGTTANAWPMLAIVTESAITIDWTQHMLPSDGRAPSDDERLRAWTTAWRAAYDQGCRPAGDDTGPTLLIAAEASVRYPRLADVVAMAFASGFDAVALLVVADAPRPASEPPDGPLLLVTPSTTGWRVQAGDASRDVALAVVPDAIRELTPGPRVVGLVPATQTSVGEVAMAWSLIAVDAPVVLGPRRSAYLAPVDTVFGHSGVGDNVEVLVARRPSPAQQAAMRDPPAPAE